jgi:protein-S-isoprenylcysteine O-methyltransferase Ste14
MLAVGTALAFAGTAFRVSAYRALGRHFTFELAIHNDHTLITAYPYSIVRHPSYTGFIATIAGAGLALGTRNGWVRAALLPRLASAHDAGKGRHCWLLWTRRRLLLVHHAHVLLASGTEDAMMRKQFGPQRDAWASRVPYKIVPLVF